MNDRNRFSSLLVATLVLAVGLALPAVAQVSTGIIEVDTNDEQGEALPGVSILVVNQDTGAQRATTSDARGLAVLPALPPGDYTISVSMPGFASAQEEVTIYIGQTARVVFTG